MTPPIGKLPVDSAQIKGDDDPLVCEMIAMARFAGEYRELARRNPDQAELFLRVAAGRSARATEAAGRVAARGVA